MEVLAILSLQSLCQMSRKEQEASSENMFRLDESIFGVRQDMSSKHIMKKINFWLKM